MKLELIYDPECPNVNQARQHLTAACQRAGLEPYWIEWDRSAADSPVYVQRFGSPTILVEGKDVSPDITSGNSCRLYADEEGRLGRTPMTQVIVDALNRGGTPKVTHFRKFLKSAAALPPVAIALLPKLTCAACWPAYAGLLSSLGVGFFDYTTYLLPITAGALVLTMVTLGWNAKNRRGYGPFILGASASVFHLLTKFFFGNEIFGHIGIGVLILAAVWNLWPVKKPVQSCNSCAE